MAKHSISSGRPPFRPSCAREHPNSHENFTCVAEDFFNGERMKATILAGRDAGRHYRDPRRFYFNAGGGKVQGEKIPLPFASSKRQRRLFSITWRNSWIATRY